jgi:pyruvate carboxylase
MSLTSLLIANRGEIAIRIMRAAAELGMRTVTVFSEDDTLSLHTRKADEARPLRGTGVAAYLDGEHILAVARETGCDAIHPGYGFLSENAWFARRCAEEGITFVGPRAETLELFGNKVQARALAERCQSEALQAFGNGDVYVEQLIPRARHIEVQVIGDRSGIVSHLWERECSIQRRHQKLVEIAPCPGLPPNLRARLIAAAVRLAQAVGYDNVGSLLA